MSYWHWAYGNGYYNFWDYLGAWAGREFQTIQRKHTNLARVKAKSRLKPKPRKPTNSRTIKRAFKR